MAGVAYWGVTSAAGNALGTTLVCPDIDNHPTYVGNRVKVMTGGAFGQDREVMAHVAGGILTVAQPFTNAAGAAQQIAAGTIFCILTNTGGGGGAGPVSPSIGLWMFGVCDPAMVASTTTIVCPNLAGFPDDIFNHEFWMQVIHNDDAPGTAPEREWRQITDYDGATGTFTTDAFSANVEADDLVAVVHESIVGMEILGYGTLTASSATVPADANRVGTYPWENNDYYKGCILMPTSGDCRFQPRPIRSYLSATGVFTLDEPFSQVPGLVDYVIIRSDYPVQRLTDIFNLVNAMLVTTETGGTLTTTGAVQDVYINNAPAGVYEPLCVKLDLSDMTPTETVVVQVLYRIRPAPAALTLQDTVTFAGAQAIPIKKIELDPNRYGVEVTLQLTAGANIDVPWEVLYRV